MMENRTKIILTILGLAAIVVPAILLIVFSGRGTDTSPETVPVGGTRQLRQDAIQNEVNNSKPSPALTSPSPSVSPTPTPASLPTNPPLEATGSGGVN